MGIEVIAPGTWTTVQDGGRIGYQKDGVSPSGAMDRKSFEIANILLGNARGEAALEATLMGPTLRFAQEQIFAITGAQMSPKLNGEPAPMYQAVRAEAGDLLTMGFADNGIRAYIAFAGGLDIPLVMESKSTLAMKNLGGFQGRKLERGDVISFARELPCLPQIAMRHAAAELFPTDEIIVRVVFGPQDGDFSEAERASFLREPAFISSESDRQGIRLERERPLRHLTDGNIISDGITAGAIQVPPNGQPILMMADHQTVGGYPKIAHVISADLPRLAQARPGMSVRFLSVSVELAQELYLLDRAERDVLEERMGRLA